MLSKAVLGAVLAAVAGCYAQEGNDTAPVSLNQDADERTTLLMLSSSRTRRMQTRSRQIQLQWQVHNPTRHLHPSTHLHGLAELATGRQHGNEPQRSSLR